MGIKESLMGKVPGALMKDLEKAQKQSDNLIKQLNSELHELSELVNMTMDAQNEIIKGNISNYILLKKIAEHNNIEIPNPLTKMEID